ncbi:MAG: cation diffusion facilitator family transporter [Thermodesulfobacteriota bacterium]
MSDGFNKTLTKRFRFAVILTSATFVMEIVGGIMTNSLALLSDAGHVFMDVFALGLSWFALYISASPPTDTRTYGWHRAEVFASFINGASLLVVAGIIFYEAISRTLNPPMVKSVGMLVFAVIGLIVNIVVAISLKDHSPEDLNIRSAFLHVMGDLLASVGVIIGGVIIYFTGLLVVDPIISILIGLIILIGAVRIILESSNVLLEGVPKGVDLNKVAKAIKGSDSVRDLHSLHIWSICYNVYALSAHIEIKNKARDSQKSIIQEINNMLSHNFHITHTTLQIECEECFGEEVIKPIKHRHRHPEGIHQH